jgi:hypothetical protein
MSSALAGLRDVRVLKDITEADFERFSPVYMEVTNNGAEDVEISLNDFSFQGHPASEGIPIKAGTTRNIPMRVYNFKATGAVTVVAYSA